MYFRQKLKQQKRSLSIRRPDRFSSARVRANEKVNEQVSRQKLVALALEQGGERQKLPVVPRDCWIRVGHTIAPHTRWQKQHGKCHSYTEFI
uniref:Uncharacterized protein n=1 Tax=Drosophila pseudoobscura pseudoobscura TaxID=46245 RepID=A0A0R3P1Z3_DROPS